MTQPNASELRPTPDSPTLREEALATADWLTLVQAIYHGVTQGFPAETRDTCEAGMCGDYRKYRDALRAALASQPEPLDVERLADVLTELHIAQNGGCSETHRPDAEFVSIRYAARLTESDR